MRVASFVLFVATLPIVAAHSQSSVDEAKPASPCDTGAYRDFDFWAGEWVVKNASGQQQWVSPGAVLTMTGGLVDGAMVLEGPLQYLKDGCATRLRGTWTRLPDGRVRQRFVECADEGRTWTEWFDGYYSRP